MQNEQNAVQTPQQTKFYVGEVRNDPIPEPTVNPDKYLVYPEDDGYDRFRNPFSTV
jgi:hypothetical protein